MKRKQTGTFHVGGVDRRLPCLNAAILLAQTMATEASEPRQWGVFDGETKLFRVERLEDRSITTTPLKEAE